MLSKGFRVFGTVLLFIFSMLALSGGGVKITENEHAVFAQLAAGGGGTAEKPGIKPVRIPLDISRQEEAKKMVKTLTFLSFNIHSAIDMNGDVKLDDIIEEIRGSGADVIGLQEVERFMPRSGYKDQIKLIAEALGYFYYYGGNLNILGARYGNAVLSKYPIMASDNLKLPKNKLEPRGLIEAEIDVDGIEIKVFVTHLGLDAKERMKQIRFINDRIAQNSKRTIFMGDFNNRLDSPEMEHLSPDLADAAVFMSRDDQSTYSLYQETPSFRLDRIYVSQDLSIVDYTILPSQVSDHARVIVTVDLNMAD
ncbi:MAG TPA: endonuclease/exonuclease/phosphatase family protein [Candidatus Atribacteria bacterium]|nr:endonuclease/exonuclease/phosphatase family protein [Candidatus Atribacteria bacterium]